MRWCFLLGWVLMLGMPLTAPFSASVDGQDSLDAQDSPTVEKRKESQKLFSVPPGYFDDLLKKLKIDWPKNRRISFVFHGHSVPAGYFQTPKIQTFDAYPMLFHHRMCEQFPTAQIDISVTAIGGEESSSGAERFDRDVLALSPDVVFIDYSLNDRRIGLEKAEKAWRSMIEGCQARDIKVVLLTPTADTRENIIDENGKLSTHAAQVRRLAEEYKIPLVDSYAKFGLIVKHHVDLSEYMSSVNHPNRAGHELVSALLAELFKK